MSEELRKKLAQVEDKLRSLREEKASKTKVREEKKDAYAEVPEGEDEAETKAYDEAKEAVRAVGEIEDKIVAEQEKQVEILKMLGDKEAAQRAAPSTQRPASPGDAPEAWSSEHVFADEEIRAQLEFISGSKSRFGSMQLGEIANREVLVADLAPTVEMRRGQWRGVVPQLVRPLRVLDLIPTGPADGNLIPYTQESGPLTGALETAEGDPKPEAGITWTDEDAPVRTIAAWMKLRKQGLSDFAALRTIVDTRLRYLVQRRLEGQVLSGGGTGSDLTGILATNGIGNVPFDATVPLTELILSGITNVYLAEGEADGVVMNPVDWQRALTEKAHNEDGTVGSYEYQGGGPFGTTPMTIWGVPNVPSPALSAGTSLVADFALGATLLIREGVNVLLSDSDQDDFIRNRVTMLGEMRAALPVWRPAVFQEVELA